MIGSHVLRWTLTVVFALTGVYCLARCLLPAGGGRVALADRLAALTHLLMSLVMVALLWSWRLGGGRGVSIAVFAAAACWFGIRAVVAGERGAPAGGRLEPAQHAVAMGTMVWMILLVPVSMGSPAASGAHSMPGMAMPPAGMTSGPGLLPAGDATVVNAVLGTYFLVATLWWMGRAARQSWATASLAGSEGTSEPGRGGTGVAPARAGLFTSGLAIASHALMSAGTGVMLLAMW
jgi:hypothetical protein